MAHDEIDYTAIRIVPEILSDGSKVFNVHIGGALKVDAVSLDDAFELAEKIAAAIDQHTTGEAKVFECAAA